MPKRHKRAYELMLEWGIIDHRHEQAILQWSRLVHAEKPPLCHYHRVVRREVSFGRLFDIFLKNQHIKDDYDVQFLTKMCSQPEYGAHIRETCEKITDVLRRFGQLSPPDKTRPLCLWLKHWAYFWPRDQWAIECYTEGQLYPSSPRRLWFDALLPADYEARIRASLEPTTERAALDFTQTADWPRLRAATDAAANLMNEYEDDWPMRSPYTEEGEIPFLERSLADRKKRVAEIRGERARDGTSQHWDEVNTLRAGVPDDLEEQAEFYRMNATITAP